MTQCITCDTQHFMWHRTLHVAQNITYDTEHYI